VTRSTRRYTQPDRAAEHAGEHAEWLRDNADAIHAWNQYVETNGTFSDSVRKF
jgi:post-segregation antitoxin (ccd killing protein)